ncbi:MULTISPECIES: VOC family protein [unclassified Minwuia]|uniref:VOC family protein n=1 Tax=unclassified Minwuia TaxID=2618799 RepID=UPI00247AA4F8|nr:MULTISPECIES: VOC family protein [unclassified Minwuia]
MTAAPALVRDIDHLMVHVHDADRAGRHFEELGFTVTPKSTMAALGLSNRCVLFQPASDLCCNYIELMAKEDPDRVPAFMQDVLGTDEGPVSLVMATPDARAAAAQLPDLGVPCHPPFDVERDWHLADGVDVRVAFGVCVPETGHAPLYWNLCEHRTREHYVRPDITRHANGAQRIATVGAIAADPHHTATRLGAQWSAQVTQVGSGRCQVAPGKVVLSVGPDPAADVPRIVSLHLEGLARNAEASLYGLHLKAV